MKFGGTNIFAIGIGVTALLTVFTPLLVKANVYLLLVVRIVEGIFEVSKLILFTTRHCIIYLLLMYSTVSLNICLVNLYVYALFRS